MCGSQLKPDSMGPEQNVEEDSMVSQGADVSADVSLHPEYSCGREIKAGPLPHADLLAAEESSLAA